jgi:hypothetical protein
LGAGYLKAKEDKKAATELREPNYETIPPGGLIIVQVNANTIGSAVGRTIPLSCLMRTVLK